MARPNRIAASNASMTIVVVMSHYTSVAEQTPSNILKGVGYFLRRYP
jgi:hypothetical protein